MLLGQMITRIREELGLTQTELARKTGVTDVYVCFLENGKRFANSYFYNRLARVAAGGCDKSHSRIYDELIALDLQTRNPNAYCSLARHFSYGKVGEAKEVLD